jgi:hypothetical protein
LREGIEGRGRLKKYFTLLLISSPQGRKENDGFINCLIIV